MIAPSTVTLSSLRRAELNIELAGRLKGSKLRELRIVAADPDALMGVMICVVANGESLFGTICAALFGAEWSPFSKDYEPRFPIGITSAPLESLSLELENERDTRLTLRVLVGFDTRPR